MEVLEKSSKKLEQRSFPVDGMTCASCAVSLESHLGSKRGVSEVIVNYPNKSLLVSYDPDLAEVEDLELAAAEIGYKILTEEQSDLEQQIAQVENKRLLSLRKKLIISSFFSVPVFLISMFFQNLVPKAEFLLLVLTIPVMFYSGSEFFVKAYQQARHRTTSMDTLVALSTGIAFVFSVFNTLFPQILQDQGLESHVYYESAVIIITLILLGRYLEETAKGKTTQAVKKLVGLRPDSVTAIRNGEEVQIPISDLFLGDLVIVKPGGKIPVDGKVKRGESFVDESMITGEPEPVLKIKRSKVYAGTINQNGSITIIVEKLGGETALGKIIELVRDAQATKPPVQNKVDKIAGIFVPTVIAFALISSLTWYLIGPEPRITYSFLILITVLIIACPCALGLATPTALMVGIGRGADLGILIKNSQALELGEKVNKLVLDKTGTITEGMPKVVDFEWLGESKDFDALVSIEILSEHPLSNAIVDFFKFRGAKAKSVQNFRSFTGKGVSAHVDGKAYCIGNEAFMIESSVLISDKVATKILSWKEQATSVVFFARGEELLGVIAVTDQIKESSILGIRSIKSLGVGVAMLTGDHYKSAENIANLAVIEEFKADLRPEDKLFEIEKLRRQGDVVAMGGDGINDSAAMAKADVGIAMGSGTDVALETADCILVRSDIRDIYSFFKLSKATMKVLRQNLFWAFVYNITAIPIAAGVLFPFTGTLLNPMIAGAAMAFSSVSVVTNSLRLKRVNLSDE